MKTKIKHKNKSYFYCFSFTKELFVNALLIILIGVFLLPQFAYSSEINKETIIKLTNKTRAELSLDDLAENSKLNNAAAEKAKYILSSGQFQHNIGGYKFSDWIKKQGYQYSYVGENLAVDFISSEGVIEAWKKSPLHYKNLVNPDFKEIGVAVLAGVFENEDTVLVVQIFGTPLNVARSAEENISAFSNTEDISRQIELGNSLSVRQASTGGQLGNLLNMGERNALNDKYILDIDLDKLIERKDYAAAGQNYTINFNRKIFTNIYFLLLLGLAIFYLYCSFAFYNIFKYQKYG